MIRYLSDFEKEQSLPLWRQAFPEDDDVFLDYYCRQVMKTNRILVWEQDGAIRGMIHRNPYQVQAGGQLWDSEYLVGVATDKNYRHQGIMRRLLQKSLADARAAGLPFVFLMPASEAIYTPFGFCTVSSQPAWQLPAEAFCAMLNQTPGVHWQAYTPQDGEETAAFANQALARQFSCFVHRTGGHFTQVQEELAMDNGTAVIGRDTQSGRIRAVFSYTAAEAGEDGHLRLTDLIFAPEDDALKQSLYLPLKPYRQPDTPLIMVRPADLQAFLQLIAAKTLQPFAITLQITGASPDGADETWRLSFAEGRCRASLCTDIPNRADASAGADARLSAETAALPLSALVQWLFGVKPLEELTASGQIRCSSSCEAQLAQIIPFHGFCANDSV